MAGWGELIFGSMYSGKSEELIRRLKRAQYGGQQYKLFKPELDNRYSNNKVVTHENNDITQNVNDVLESHLDSKVKKHLVQRITENLSGSLVAHSVKNAEEILDLTRDNIDVVGIDEVQFFDEDLIKVIDKLIKKDIRVIMAGLDLYSSEEPFGIVPKLACKTKYVDKLHAVCVDCGENAYISHKIDNNNDNKKSNIDVGSTGKYIPLCKTCREKRLKNEKTT
jgi:thymidine kinase